MAASRLFVTRCVPPSSPQLLRNLATSNFQISVDEQDVSLAEAKPFKSIPGPPKNIRMTIKALYDMIVHRSFQKPWLLYKELHDKHGDIVNSGFGSFENILLLDPKDFEKVLRDEGKYPRRIDISPWVAYRDYRGKAKGVLLTENQVWKRNRLAVSKRMLRPKEVVEYAPTINSVVTSFVDRIERKRLTDENFVVHSIEQDLFKYAMDAGGSVLLDSRLNLLDDNLHIEEEEFIESVHGIFKDLMPLMVIPVKYHRILNTNYWKRHTKAWDTIFDYAKKLIDDKINRVYKELKNDNQTEKKADFLTYLVQQNKISVEEIYANCTELLAAAVDTTSNTTLWCIYMLASNPDAQERLHQEVKKVIPDNEIPMPKHIDRMPYLKSVVKETLRLYPPAISISRRLDKDIVLRGYRIPAGVCKTI
uniref:Cholesterol side-chain cleavage enzyme, mitochondrial n=1 Tax=Saccoglossus kowalevskii TaxID=10224 RepID=A0ABM0MHG4_SACKO|nr:PREDICTED: 1,25-dihydroxyvitamin D(3) 24-hydroxylase, mitochondrial-like [Saccoglossus kowalevskii]